MPSSVPAEGAEKVRSSQVPLLSVVIPAYNEAARLSDAVKRITAYLEAQRWSYEVLIVDDGSDDDTEDVIHQLSSDDVRLVTHPRNLGKGAAARSGVLASRGTWILLTDADLSAPIEELKKLMQAAEGADLVYGSRALAESRIEAHQPPQRELLGRLFNLFARRVLRLTTLRDTQCGFKLIRGDVARQLFPGLRISRYAFDVELGWQAERQGYRVRESGVVWRDSGTTSVRPWRDGTRMLIDLLWLRLRGVIAPPDSRPFWFRTEGAAVGLALLLVVLAVLHHGTANPLMTIASVVAYWTALGWVGARVSRCLVGRLSPAQRLTTGFTVTIALLVTPLVVLGHCGWLSARNAMLTAASILLASRLLRVLCQLPAPRSSRRHKTWHEAAARGAVATSMVILVVCLGEAIQDGRYLHPGANAYDDNYYHLPAAVEWLQHGDLRMLKIGVGDPSPAFYPINSELVAWSHLALMAGNDFTARFVELPFALGCLVGIVAVARAFGLGTYPALTGALLFATIPSFPLRMLSAGNDLAMAFFMLASVHALALFFRRPSLRRAVYAGVTVGLLFGTKYTVLAFGPALLLLACLVVVHRRVRLASSRRTRGRPAVVGVLMFVSLAAGAAMITGGYTYVRNAVTTGNPIYPSQLTIGDRVLLPGRRSHTPEALYRRRQAVMPAGEFLWDRRDLFGPMFRWTLLPAAVAAPVAALLMPSLGRRRRRFIRDFKLASSGRPDYAVRRPRYSSDGIITAVTLALPAMFYAAFFYLVADQRDVRYLFPALALAATAFAWLVQKLPGLWRSVLMVIVAIATAPVLVSQFGHEFPQWASIALPLVVAAIQVLTWRRRRPDAPSGSSSLDPVHLRSRLPLSLRRYRFSIRILIAASLIVTVWLALAQTAEEYRNRRLDPREAAAFVDRLTAAEPAVIAYAGGNQPYLFFGRQLGNEILYVPTYDVEGAVYYTWGSSLAMPRGPRDRVSWYRNLAKFGVRYLIIAAGNLTPPELSWVEQLECCHDLLWRRGAVRIYSLHPDELTAHFDTDAQS